MLFSIHFASLNFNTEINNDHYSLPANGGGVKNTHSGFQIFLTTKSDKNGFEQHRIEQRRQSTSAIDVDYEHIRQRYYRTNTTLSVSADTTFASLMAVENDD
jgi:hypothetical protein